MFWGLMLTSAGFAVPALLAVRKKLWVTASSCGILTLTSMSYHGTLNELAKLVDMCVAHSMATGWGAHCAHLLWKQRRPADGVVAALTIGGVAVYWFKSRTNHHHHAKYWHMLFHLVIQSAWCTHIQLANPTPNHGCRPRMPSGVCIECKSHPIAIRLRKQNMDS